MVIYKYTLYKFEMVIYKYTFWREVKIETTSMVARAVAEGALI